MIRMKSPDYERIGVAGDWHGNKAWSRHVIEKLAEEGIKHVLHVGDFGFWPGNHGRKYLYRVEKFLAIYDITLYVTLGNHEDYIQLSRFNPHPTMEGFVYNRNYPHILVAKRGARWEWNGVSFMSLGGANSIDFAHRRENFTWWPGESITISDVDRALDGGYADVMISHDCPDGVNLPGTLGNKDDGWSEEELVYAQQSRDMLRTVVNGVKPGILFHGHYHRFYDTSTVLNDGNEDYTLRSVGLDMDGSPDNLLVVEIATRAYTKPLR